MIASPEIFENRVKNFQEKLRDLGINCAMIRTLSDFKYFTGTKWLRPALLVPSEAMPVAFVAKGEEEGFLERSKLKNIEIVTYVDGGDLMGKVSSSIRSLKAKKVGMVFGVERDSYILFYEMFKRANRDVDVVDIGPVIQEMRAFKSGFEVEAISRAAGISSQVLEKTLAAVKEGVSETDLAAEAYYAAYKLGSEEPHIYVNIGPNPRIHAEPLRDVKVRNGILVTVIVGCDFDGYYANTAASVFMGPMNDEVANAFKCVREVYQVARDLTIPGARLIHVIKQLDMVYARYGFIENRVLGYAHGVGLQVEEYPITTIVPAHRTVEVKTGMVLASVHSPLMLKKYGSLKLEDTFIVMDHGLKLLTKAWEFASEIS